jgi:methionyl-tRNA synthetase
LRGKFYLTTAIDYVNTKPHLGNAYEKVAADCIARAHRYLGYDVRFVMGNDEHSLNVERSARQQKLAPKEYCDRMEHEFRGAWRRLNISFDDFIRTSEPRHHKAVAELLRRVRDNGYIRRGKYTGWYCEGCEAFYTEKDLVDGQCPNHATTPRWVEEDNWFFKLSEFRDSLLEHIAENPSFVRPSSRRNEIVSLLTSGLQDVSISRPGLTWGIPFPGDPGHVVYVWFDALTNYISSVGYGTDPASFEKWWPADVHIIGKDITRFHCVIWPAMLMAAGEALPKSVFGHGFIYHAGSKMSKSLGNIVNPLDVVEVTGADALRYYLLREIVFGNDGDFTWESFIARYNADLANDLGNLVKRATDMALKFLDGEIRVGGGTRTSLRTLVEEALRESTRSYEELDLSLALASTWLVVRRANQVIQDTKPWELAKDSSRRGELVELLGEIFEAIRVVSHLLEPAMPERSPEIRERLGLPKDPDLFWEKALPWREGSSWRASGGNPVFPRLVQAPEAAPAPSSSGDGKRNRFSKARPAAGPPSPRETPQLIDIAAFRDVELVVATVRKAERVEGADRLLKLSLDVGSEERQVVSGIADRFSAQDLVGRQVVLVANLKPAKIRGIESQGMILVAQAEGKMALLVPGETIAPGARIS